MTTRLRRMRKRQRRNEHTGQIDDKKKRAQVIERTEVKRRQARKKKRRDEVKRVNVAYAIERSKEAAMLKNVSHPWSYEEQKARQGLRRAADRIAAYGRLEEPAF